MIKNLLSKQQEEKAFLDFPFKQLTSLNIKATKNPALPWQHHKIQTVKIQSEGHDNLQKCGKPLNQY